MENKTLSNLNAALILLLIMVVYTLVINLGGFQSNAKLSWISYLIVAGGIMLLVMKFGKDKHNNVTFGNLFAYGFKTTAFLILFYIAFTIIFYLVFPEYKTQLLDIARENALKSATPETKDQVEKGIEIFQRFFWVSIIAGVLISFAVLGAIGSLLGAAVTKKEPNNFAGDVNQIGQ